MTTLSLPSHYPDTAANRRLLAAVAEYRANRVTKRTPCSLPGVARKHNVAYEALRKLDQAIRRQERLRWAREGVSQ